MKHNDFYRQQAKNPKVVITCKNCGHKRTCQFNEMITAGVQCPECKNKPRIVKSTYELMQAIKEEYAAAVKSGPSAIQECPICKFKTCLATRFELHTRIHNQRGEFQ